MALRFVGLSLLAITLGLCLKLGLLGWQQGTANIKVPVLFALAIAPVLEIARRDSAVRVQDISAVFPALPAFHVATVKPVVGDDFIRNEATRGQGFPELLDGVRHGVVPRVESGNPPEEQAAIRPVPPERSAI
jgi:hypothetical protein